MVGDKGRVRMASGFADSIGHVLGGWIRLDLRASGYRIRPAGKAVLDPREIWCSPRAIHVCAFSWRHGHTVIRNGGNKQPRLVSLWGHSHCRRHFVLGTPDGDPERLKPDKRRF